MSDDTTTPPLFDWPPDAEAALDLAPPAWCRPYLRVGTCSWKYDSWKGLLYDRGKRYRPGDYLSDYAGCLDSVEVDQWYWSLFPTGVRLPAPGTVEAYASAVPPEFRFTVKAPNALTLTHFPSRQPAAQRAWAGKPNRHFLDPQLLRGFLDSLASMRPNLGPIILQFSYLNRESMPSLSDFLDRLGPFLRAAPPGYLISVETRNPNYLREPFFDLLRECETGYVFVDGYYMPPVGDVHRTHEAVTAPFSVIRLLGPDRGGIEEKTGRDWSRIVSPNDAGLDAVARIVHTNVQRRIVTYVDANNHYEGSAPLTIRRLIDRLGEETRG